MAYRTTPAPTTPLLGRERAVAAACALIQEGETRLLTLTGPGGVGKTRLGIAVAAALQARFADGIAWAPLAALADATLAPATVAQALGLHSRRGTTDLEALTAHLRERRLLLVLDNCEHLVAAVAALVADLLAGCPLLVVLATSRAPLRIQGEQEMTVTPLPPPDPAHLPALAILADNPAVRLFVTRARAAAGDFALTAANAADVAEICARLDGLPLALELAAARAKVLSSAAIRARLDDRLRLLTGGTRDRLARHRAVRDTIAWSYDLLAPPEQVLFRRLVVFAGGWTLEAAEAVCADAAPSAPGAELSADGEVMEGLAALVDQSLVRRGTAGAEAVRFTMLETIRAYAWERLRESGEAEIIARRHAAYYRALAEAGDEGIRGHEQVAWLERLEAEHDNLRAALQGLIARGQDGDAAAVEQGLHLAGALWFFWWLHGHMPEGMIWLTRLLAQPLAAARTAGRARALFALGYLQGWKRICHEEGLAIQQELGDSRGRAYALLGIANAARFKEGDVVAARPPCVEALALFRRVGDTWGEAWALTFLAQILYAAGEYDGARTLYEESLPLRRELGDRQGLAYALRGLGDVCRAQGEVSAASALYDESLTLFREVGDRMNTAELLFIRGGVAAERGDSATACAAYAECLTIRRDTGDRWGIALMLDVLADLALPVQPERGGRLAGAASLIWEDLGGLPPALNGRGGLTLAHRERAARRAPGDETWLQAWAAGRTMTPNQAIADALAALEAVAGATCPTVPPEMPALPQVANLPAGRGCSPLTAREREVAALVARGYTNRAIAAALVIAERTATNHVAHILTKLDVHTRAQIAAWAVEHGLLPARDTP